MAPDRRLARLSNPQPFKNPRGAISNGNLCPASRDGRIRRVDQRAKEHALGRILPVRYARLFEVRRIPPALGVPPGYGPLPVRATNQNRDRHIAGSVVSNFLVAKGHNLLEARCHAFAPILHVWRNSRGPDGLARANANRGRRRKFRADIRPTRPLGRARNLVLSREAGLALQPDLHLSALDGRSERVVAMAVS